jgi:hypothetical protein
MDGKELMGMYSMLKNIQTIEQRIHAIGLCGLVTEG